MDQVHRLLFVNDKGDSRQLLRIRIRPAGDGKFDSPHPGSDGVSRRDIAIAGPNQDGREVPFADPAERPAKLAHGDRQLRWTEPARGAQADDGDDASDAVGDARIGEKKRPAEFARECLPIGELGQDKVVRREQSLAAGGFRLADRAVKGKLGGLRPDAKVMADGDRIDRRLRGGEIGAVQRLDFAKNEPDLDVRSRTLGSSLVGLARSWLGDRAANEKIPQRGFDRRGDGGRCRLVRRGLIWGSRGEEDRAADAPGARQLLGERVGLRLDGLLACDVALDRVSVLAAGSGFAVAELLRPAGGQEIVERRADKQVRRQVGVRGVDEVPVSGVRQLAAILGAAGGRDAPLPAVVEHAAIAVVARAIRVGLPQPIRVVRKSGIGKRAEGRPIGAGDVDQALRLRDRLGQLRLKAASRFEVALRDAESGVGPRFVELVEGRVPVGGREHLVERDE
ncbi:MAG TPA: hypothetical protein VFU81_08960, partial [Thermomicrobiales bacterium]|nr:hypothetical protein [Thermomicrobiales bacterium]